MILYNLYVVYKNEITLYEYVLNTNIYIA
jgi:hypothetical protein